MIGLRVRGLETIQDKVHRVGTPKKGYGFLGGARQAGRQAGRQANKEGGRMAQHQLTCNHKITTIKGLEPSPGPRHLAWCSSAQIPLSWSGVLCAPAFNKHCLCNNKM